MSTKLTLSIDEAVIEKAKVFARSRRKSLSKVIEQYLEYVTENDASPLAISETVAKLADTLVVDRTDDALKYAYLKDKYLDASDSD